MCAVSMATAELELVERIEDLARKNEVYRSYIGLGYFSCIMPAVIKRNILENPGWSVSLTHTNTHAQS